jgi:hypothetical protein
MEGRVCATTATATPCWPWSSREGQPATLSRGVVSTAVWMGVMDATSVAFSPLAFVTF